MLNQNDFEALQKQLLDLKGTNYILEDRCKKLTNENNILKQTNENLDKQLQKANKIVNKTKNAKEIDNLIQECEGLQTKLLTQEHDFRLQNQTLMQELSHVIKMNDQYEEDMRKLKNECNINSNKCESEELISLKAQNGALKNSLKESQNEIKKLTIKIEEYRNKKVKENGEVNGHTNGESNGHENGHDENHSETNGHANGDDVSLDLSENIVELKLKLKTEEEEKVLLKEAYNKEVEALKVTVADNKSLIESLNERLQRKQEAVLQLQSEKDQISKQIGELKTEIQNLKNDLAKVNDEKKVLNEKCHKADEHIKMLESEIGNVSAENNQQLRVNNEKFEAKIQELNKNVAELMQDKENLKIQLEESRSSYMNILEEIQKMENEKEMKLKSIDELTKLADKRKQMVDEVVLKMQQESVNFTEEIKALKQNHEQQCNSYSMKINELEELITEIKPYVDNCKQLEKEIRELTESKKSTEQMLNDAKAQLQKEIESNAIKINQLTSDLDEKLSEANKDFAKEKEIFEIRNSELVKQITEVRSQNDKLNDELKDEFEAKRIIEKKNLAIVKDLKRQLNLEKKRADKLQEKLGELLSNSDIKFTIDEFNYNDYESKKSYGGSSINGNGNGETCSLSSLNTIESVARTNNNGNSGVNLNMMSSQSNLDESKQLLDKIAQLQEQNWKLEERVNHLETANAAMATDLMNKTSIISYYSLDKKHASMNSSNGTNNNNNNSSSSHGISLKSFMSDILNNKNSTEDVKKLQRLLEETLTKNMHLEQDMEKLTKEMQKLKSR